MYTKPHVQEAIRERRKEQQKRTQITADMVLEGLLQEAKRPDERGGSTHARISAWKALGKHLGLFEDKVEHSGEVDTGHVVVYLPDNGRGGTMEPVHKPI